MPGDYNRYSTPLRNRGGTSLPEAVAHQFGSHKCPCCGVHMTRKPVRKFKRTPANQQTVAHDFPVGRGGDRAQWFWGCSRCNNDQGVLDLVTWARKLVYGDDPRTERVVALATFIRDWVKALKEEVSA